MRFGACNAGRNDFAVFGYVDNVVAVAHTLGAEFEKAVFGGGEVVCAPELGGGSLPVVVTHYGCPRNTVGVNLFAKLHIGEHTPGVVACESD